MAVSTESAEMYNNKISTMSDEKLIEQYLRVMSMGFNFERELALKEILWRMGYGRGGVK